MFDAWQNFYLLAGPAAATLIGWLFVIATINAGFDREKVIRGTRVYSTPTVFHFAAVTLVSAVALMPHLPSLACAGAIAVSAGAGLVYCGFVGRSLLSGRLEGHWADFWTFAVAVGVAYAGILAAGLLVAVDDVAAPWLLAVSVLALLMIGIYNSWDLVTWIAIRAKSQ
jgi:hypothetical protein